MLILKAMTFEGEERVADTDRRIHQYPVYRRTMQP